MPKEIEHSTLLGIDFGMKRIGIAIGQSLTQTARPLTVLKARDGVPSWDAIQELLDEWSIDGCVVGLPFNTDGSEQEITLAARKFARKLEGRFNLPIYLVDERYTTKLAQDVLRAHGINPAKHGAIDSVAAQLILESWWGDAA